MTLREEMAGQIADFYEILPEQCLQVADIIITLFKERVEKIENPYSKAWDYDQYPSAEKMRQAILKMLEE